MKALVVYDSQYGNTEQIARAIAKGIGSEKEVRVVKAAEATVADVAGLNILVIGSPTQGGRPTPPVRQFLDRLPDDKLKSLRVAAFDTRATSFITKLFGYAAGRIGQSLEARGAVLAAPPEAFIVKGTKGPLADGELDRATKWGKDLATHVTGK